jgi:hypothetical protein
MPRCRRGTPTMTTMKRMRKTAATMPTANRPLLENQTKIAETRSGGIGSPVLRPNNPLYCPPSVCGAPLVRWSGPTRPARAPAGPDAP